MARTRRAPRDTFDLLDSLAVNLPVFLVCCGGTGAFEITGLAVVGGSARCRGALRRLGVSEGVLRTDFDMQTDFAGAGLVLFSCLYPKDVDPLFCLTC